MTDLSAALFARYRRIVRGTFVGVLLVACALIYLQYIRTLRAETRSLSDRMGEQSIALDAIMKNGVDAVNAMRLHAETWYRLHPQTPPALQPVLQPALPPPSPLVRALQRCGAPGRICLDDPPLPWSTRDVGNLTGVPGALTPELVTELEMALSLNDPFRTIIANLPAAAWVYYTSARRFINIYPWTPSSTFFYADTLKQKDFFLDVEPTRNPARRVVWTPAYIDEAGKGMMVTTSAGVFDHGQFRGAVSLDLTLTQLNRFVDNWHTDFGTLFIINDRHQLIAHPTLVRAGASTVQPADAAFPAAARVPLVAALDAVRNHLTLVHGYYIETRRIASAPFTLVLLVPQRDIVVSSLQSGVLAALLLVVGLTTMLAAANRFTHHDAVQPAQMLVRYIQDESNGAAKTIPAVPAAWQPWFRTIQHVFNAHARLVSIQQELDVARRMQQSIVPKRFPTRDDLQMFAHMIPATEVGGDFYDYFWLTDTQLGVVIADVSGKGVPAALFMAVARTLLRAIAPAATGPAECLALANDLLSQDNDATMFVTLFYGVLDTRTGMLTYANGGHPAPYLLAADGTVATVPGTGGIALGVIDGLAYAARAVQLAPGTTLLLYTDGVTEAFDPQGDAFGDARLAALLANLAGCGVETLLDRLVDGVHAFADGAPQSDDITCLGVRFATATP